MATFLTGRTRSAMFVLEGKKNKKRCLRHSGHVHVQGAIHVIFLFFNDTNLSMVVRKNKNFMGEEFICLLKKQNYSRAEVSCRILPERNVSRMLKNVIGFVKSYQVIRFWNTSSPSSL